MGYKCTFMDNDIYSAQDVNEAFSNMISGGVSSFAYTGNTISDMNSAVSQIIQSGVQVRGEACKLKNINNVYKICQGTCFMNDGSQITFDSEGYVIEPEEGVHQYVYFERNLLGNTIDVVLSTSAGGEGTIPIAEIDENGRINDKRRFARSNVLLTAEPQNISSTGILQAHLLSGESCSVDVGFNGWKYILYDYDSGMPRFKEFPDGTYITLPLNNSGRGERSNVVTERNGSVLTVTNYAYEYNNINFSFEVR